MLNTGRGRNRARARQEDWENRIQRGCHPYWYFHQSTQLVEADNQGLAEGTVRRGALPERSSPGRPSKQEHCLFTVTGEKLAGPATALIIGTSEADATYFALNELGFVTVSGTYLVSDSVYVGPADTRHDS